MGRKPSIFISHSSLDKKILGILKSRIHEMTVGSVDIFVSSDGESIPIGKNWLASIEQGLNESEVMFLFITPNSINNMWVAFEAGFGYSKEINVIPICFGVSVSDLKPPLSILQGFDLNSYESLNNIISKINNQFDLSCKLDFNQKDFQNLKQANGENEEHDFFPIIESASINYGQRYEMEDESDSIAEKIAAGLIEETNKYLKEKAFDWSMENNRNTCTFSLPGIEINLSGPKSQEEYPERYNSELSIDISCFGLKTNLLNSIEYMQTVLEVGTLELVIKLKNPFNLIAASKDVSAILGNLGDIKRNPDNPKEFVYKNVKFHLGASSATYAPRASHLKSTIRASISNKSIDDLYELLDTLLEHDIIYVDSALLSDNLRQIEESKRQVENIKKQIKDDAEREARRSSYRNRF